jgi:hypothetical protein
MANKKPGAPKGAANASVAAPAAAPVASAANVTEEKVAEAVQEGSVSAEAVDVVQSDTTVETAVNAQDQTQTDKGSEGSAGEASASDATDALQALGFGGPLDGKQEEAIPAPEWPRTYRATNNTRMHLCIPVHGLTVERFGAHTDIVISSEGALAGLKAEMDAIAFLNSFDDKAFLLEHVAGE